MGSSTASAASSAGRSSWCSIAEPLRKIGRYTFVDVLAYRLPQRSVRITAALGALTVVLFYLTVQMVGAGNLIRYLFGLPYEFAVFVVGLVLLAAVLFGGMIATTWVQIVKAVLLLGGATALAVLALLRFGLNPAALFDTAASKYGSAVLAPGGLLSDPLDAISLGLALMLGTAGLPHILMRFYTVPDAKTARISVAYATGLIGFFYLLTFVLGYGATAIVGREAIVAVDPGGNMAAPLLAELVGGRAFLGFIAAVAFSTILAVVAGLTLAGAATLSHDLWVHVIRGGRAVEHEQLAVGRIAAVGIALVAIALGIVFKGQNISYMVSLAFAVAASANFPILVLAIYWSRLTTAGANAGMLVGTFVTLMLIIASPAIQVDILKHASGAVPAAQSGHRHRPPGRSSWPSPCRSCGQAGPDRSSSRSCNNACILPPNERSLRGESVHFFEPVEDQLELTWSRIDAAARHQKALTVRSHVVIHGDLVETVRS